MQALSHAVKAPCLYICVNTHIQVLCVCVCVWRTKDETQGLGHARHWCYQWATVPVISTPVILSEVWGSRRPDFLLSTAKQLPKESSRIEGPLSVQVWHHCTRTTSTQEINKDSDTKGWTGQRHCHLTRGWTCVLLSSWFPFLLSKQNSLKFCFLCRLSRI